jgi:hypothetical protein
MNIDRDRYILLLTMLLFRMTFLFTEAVFFRNEKTITPPNPLIVVNEEVKEDNQHFSPNIPEVQKPIIPEVTNPEEQYQKIEKELKEEKLDSQNISLKDI